MTPIVIAICGARRAGKDTVASVLEKSYGYRPMKFARYLKDMIKAGFGLSDQDVEGHAKDAIHPIYNVTPRAIMQYIGTDVMQYGLQTLIPEIRRDFWARRLIIDLRSHMSKGGDETNFVISDLRFMHEYEALKQAAMDDGFQFHVIKVCRQVLPADACLAEDSHISEREWENIPHAHCFNNNSTHEHLEAKIHDYMDTQQIP